MSNKETGYKAKTQTDKNIAWYLPRPKKDRYKGGMPLYAEEWFIKLAEDLLGKKFLKWNVLNVFCGMNQFGVRVDIKKEVKPDYVADVHELTKYIKPLEQFDFIFADPPYSTQEAKEIYNTPPLKYKQWTSECEKLLKKGGLLCVYHKYVMPNPNPTKFIVVKRVFLGSRTYHLPRIAIYFKKK